MSIHRIRALLLAALFTAAGFLWGPGLFAADGVPLAGPLSAESIALLSESRAGDWIGTMTQEISRIGASAHVPAQAYDLVLGAIGAEALPEDALDAARDLHAAAREADRARRRGVASVLLRAEIRAAWQSPHDPAGGFSFRLERRAEKAMESFAAGNRRSWDQAYLGRGGSGGDLSGPGPGGRW